MHNLHSFFPFCPFKSWIWWPHFKKKIQTCHIFHLTYLSVFGTEFLAHPWCVLQTRMARALQTSNFSLTGWLYSIFSRLGNKLVTVLRNSLNYKFAKLLAINLWKILGNLVWSNWNWSSCSCWVVLGKNKLQTGPDCKSMVESLVWRN